MTSIWEESRNCDSEQNLAFFKETLVNVPHYKLAEVRDKFLRFADRITDNARSGLLISEKAPIKVLFDKLPYSHVIYHIEFEAGINCSHYKNNSLLFEIATFFDSKNFNRIKEYLGKENSYSVQANYFDFFLNSFKEIWLQLPQNSEQSNDIKFFIMKLNAYKKIRRNSVVKF